MRNTFPAHVCNVQEAIDAAQVHKRAEIRDIFHHAFAQFVNDQRLHQFVTV